MSYDDWKTEGPDDERARIESRTCRRDDRQEYLEHNYDRLIEEREERRREQE